MQRLKRTIPIGTLYKWTGIVGVYMSDNPDKIFEDKKNKQLSLVGPYVEPGEMVLYVGPTKRNPDIHLFLKKDTLAALHINVIDEFIVSKNLIPVFESNS